MTDQERELTKQYPEASLIVELAKIVWNGSLNAARIEHGNNQLGVITLWKTKARSGA